jgi:WD40 repeat protein
LVGHQDLVYITDGLGHVIKLTKDLKVLNQYQCHQASCNTIYFNNHQAITGGSDAYLKQWDLETMTVMAQVPAHNFAIYDLMQHQQFLLSASRDKTVKVWEPHTLQLLLRIEAQSHLGHTHSVNALLDLGQQFLSAGDDRQIIAWQLRVED